jgi:hypothetical protein
MKIRLWVLFLMLAFSGVSHASEQRWMFSAKYIDNLNPTLAEAKAKIQYTQSFSGGKLPSNLFVAFPDKIPFSTTHLYADFISLKSGDGYVLEVAAKPGCEMSKACTVGKLLLQWRANPVIYYDLHNKQATTPVLLHQGIQGFYTHGFPMADFWPANLQWRYKEVLYTLTWANLENKKMFVQMANSIIDQLAKR